MNNIELLAPAGDMEKLKIAIIYGADAVYVAGERYGLRKASQNFNLEELAQAISFVHENKKKIYVTLNIIPHNHDLIGMENYLQSVIEMRPDGLIVSDPGIFQIARSIDQDMDMHLSTQTSVTNYQTVDFWRKQGFRRIILARELSLQEIREIKDRVPDAELEIFVHGAMCISYSGRCLMSNYMTGRDANQGDCAHACRWRYYVVEEKRPGEFYPIEETDDGTFLFNSKDLCMIDHLEELRNAGVSSFKIEGRVKSQYYVATVVRSYRLALDAIYQGSYSQEMAERLKKEIMKASYRDFTHGFFFGKPGSEDQLYHNSSYIRTYDFVGLVQHYDPETGMAIVEQRNKILQGDTLEHFGPEDHFHEFTVNIMWDMDGNEITVAPHPQQLFRVKLPFPVKPYDIFRKRVINQ